MSFAYRQRVRQLSHLVNLVNLIEISAYGDEADLIVEQCDLFCQRMTSALLVYVPNEMQRPQLPRGESLSSAERMCRQLDDLLILLILTRTSYPRSQHEPDILIDGFIMVDRLTTFAQVLRHFDSFNRIRRE